MLKQQTGDNLLKPSSDLLVFPISTPKQTQLHNIKNIQKEMDKEKDMFLNTINFHFDGLDDEF